MKKTVIFGGVIVALAAAYCGASWYTGNKIAAEFPAVIEQINQKQAWFTVSAEDYQRGIFSSTLKLTVSSNRYNEQFQQPITIYHGPFPWSEVKHFNLMPVAAASDLDFSFMPNLNNDDFELRTVAKYSGNLLSTLHVKQHQRAQFVSEQFLLSNQPFDLTLRLNLDENIYSIKGDIARLNLFDDNHGEDVLDVQDLRLDYLNNIAVLSAKTQAKIVAKKLFFADLDATNFALNLDYTLPLSIAPEQSIKISADSMQYYSDTLDEEFEQYSVQNVKANTTLRNDKHLTNIDLDLQAEHASFGQQDLGDLQFSGQISNLAISAPKLATKAQNSNSTISFTQTWTNPKGKSVIEMQLQTKQPIDFNSSFKEENIKAYQYSISVPLEMMAYAVAQVNSPNSKTVDPQEVAEYKQQLLAKINEFPSDIKVQTEDSAEQPAGFYSSFNYSDTNPDKISLNGEERPKHGQLHAIVRQINSVIISMYVLAYALR